MPPPAETAPPLPPYIPDEQFFLLLRGVADHVAKPAVASVFEFAPGATLSPAAVHNRLTGKCGGDRWVPSETSIQDFCQRSLAANNLIRKVDAGYRSTAPDPRPRIALYGLLSQWNMLAAVPAPAILGHKPGAAELRFRVFDALLRHADDHGDARQPHIIEDIMTQAGGRPPDQLRGSISKTIYSLTSTRVLDRYGLGKRSTLSLAPAHAKPVRGLILRLNSLREELGSEAVLSSYYQRGLAILNPGPGQRPNPLSQLLQKAAITSHYRHNTGGGVAAIKQEVLHICQQAGGPLSVQDITEALAAADIARSPDAVRQYLRSLLQAGKLQVQRAEHQLYYSPASPPIPRTQPGSTPKT